MAGKVIPLDRERRLGKKRIEEAFDNMIKAAERASREIDWRWWGDLESEAEATVGKCEYPCPYLIDDEPA
jgi:hypothetical protein